MLTIDKSPQPILEYFLQRNSTNSMKIYVTVLLVIVTMFVLLPIIHVTLSIQGTGLIRPVSEKTEVKSIISEIIEQVYIKENQFITKGSPIVQLRTDNLNSKIQVLLYQKVVIANNISDLRLLTSLQHIKNFKSPVCQQEYFYFQKQLEELQNKLDKTKKEYERNRPLFNNGVIPERDFDDLRFQYKTAENEFKISTENQINKWQSDLISYNKSFAEIESNLSQLVKEKEFYTIRAPISGTVEQFSGIYPGSSLRVGETVAIISPDSTLISEVYINPKDIGYINKNNPVRIQVDAFNYNEWGILKGNVKEISSDFLIINSNPMFKVRCSMDRSLLTLKNGIRGNLKKGMTIRARFIVANRSLFQLLYQSMDDWINPIQQVLPTSIQ